MIPALALIAAFALGVEIGRWSQRHEHRPHWDETLTQLARKDGKIQTLQEALAAEKEAHRETAARSDEHRARARDLAARLANRGAA